MNKKSEKSEKKSDTKKTEVVKKENSFNKKKKIKKNITSGIAYVYSTFNNTIISIADESGNVVSWSSAGAKGFKMTTPTVATCLAVSFLEFAVRLDRTMAGQKKAPESWLSVCSLAATAEAQG